MVSQITADELADRIDAGESTTIVDTRPRDSFDAWHVPGAMNVPYDPREGLESAQIERVREAAGDGPVTAICGKGVSSTPFVFELEDRGFEDLTVVKGGMEDWSEIYELVPVDTGREDLVIVQLQRRGKGCLGYVIASTDAGEAAVVDATRQIGVFQIAATEAGATIESVLDTHVHADHLSGGPDLAAAVEAPYYLGEEATGRSVAHEYEPLADGDVLTVGDITIETIHAPGHTSEMVNYLVDGDVLLTGDTLFVESVGRTELQFGEEGASEGARRLYETLHERILPLPADTRILPGHVSVSADGTYAAAGPGEPVEARLGDLRESLELLTLEEEAFVERLVEDAPEKPQNYEEIIAINTGREEPDSESEAVELELGPNNCAA